MSSSLTKPNEDSSVSESGSPNNMNILSESSVDITGNVNNPSKASRESLASKEIVSDRQSLPSTSTRVEKPRIQKARKTFPKPSGFRPPLDLQKTNVPEIEVVARILDKPIYEVKDMDATPEVDSDTTTIEILYQSELTCQSSPDSNTSKPALLLPLKSQNEEKMPTLQSAANGNNNEHDKRVTSFYPPKADEKLATNGDSSSDRILEEGDRLSCLASMKRNYSSGLGHSSKGLTPTIISESPTKQSNVRAVPTVNQPTPTVHPHSVIRQTSCALEDLDMPTLKRRRLDSSGSILDPLSVKDDDFRPVEDGNNPSERQLTHVPRANSLNAQNSMLSTSSPKPSSNTFKLFSPARTIPVDIASNVEAAMAALHGETEDIQEVDQPNHDASSDFSRINSPSRSDSDYVPTSSFSQKRKKKGRKSSNQNSTINVFLAAASKDAKVKTPGISREVASLLKDEGADRIHRELQGQLERKRVVRKEPPIESSVPRLRKNVGRPTKRRASKESSDTSERRHTKPSKRKSESNVQDVTLNDWEAVQKTKNGEKVVYVPKNLIHPNNNLVRIHLHSASSDSSGEGTSSKARNVKPLSGSPQFSPLSPASYLAEGGGVYASGVNNNLIEKPLVVQDKMAIKLNEDYREIQLRCTNRLLHVTLSPSSSKLQNSLNPTIVRELTSLLRKLKTENEINAVLITAASESTFCSGIDLPCLLSDSESDRRKAADSVAILVQNLILELAFSDKLLVCGVLGSVIGLGVTMLPYFDVVFASDKSTFYLPYARLGQPSEGGLPLTQLSSSRSLISVLFYEGRRVTATEAEKNGLVDSVLLHDSFRQQLKPRVEKLTAQLLPNTLQTKKTLRASLRRDLPDVLKEESELLKQSWISDEFQRRARNLLYSCDLLE